LPRRRILQPSISVLIQEHNKHTTFIHHHIYTG
jgi:hypothetical protein